MTNLTNASSTQLKAALALSEKREAEAAAKAAKAPKNYSKPFSPKQVPWAISKLMVSTLSKEDYKTLDEWFTKTFADKFFEGLKEKREAGAESSAETATCVGVKWEGQTRETVCGLSEISGELDGASYCTKHFDKAKGVQELGQTLNGNDVPVAPSAETLMQMAEALMEQAEEVEANLQTELDLS